MSGTYHDMPARALGAEIEKGALDPRELTEYFLARIKADPFSERIFTHVLATRARAEAAAAAERAKRGLRRSPLDGVPITYKDLFDTKGCETTAGSTLLSGNMPARDAVLVENLARAGLVTLAKTTMTELAFSGLGLNPYFGTPPNPFDETCERAPGGSSSGAGVALARGLCAASIGTDTGGSVRIPASWNGLTGLKTTAGRISLHGTVPLSPSLDTAGPLTKDVEDAALFFALMAGVKAPDLSHPRKRDTHVLIARGIGFEDLSPGIGEAVDHALRLFAKRGIHIKETKLPVLDEMNALTWQAPNLLAAEAYALWGEAIEKAPEKMFAPVLKRFRMGQNPDSAALGAKWKRREELRRLYLEETAGYDAVLLPTVSLSPPPIEGLMEDDAAYGKANVSALRNTTLGNQLGLSAITLPVGKDTLGLPVGLMAMGAPHGEERLLRLGRCLESVLHP